jgi:hypothetical protein
LKQAELKSGVAANGAIWLIGKQVVRWQAGRAKRDLDMWPGNALWFSPSGEPWVARAGGMQGEPGIKHGLASRDYPEEESVGLADFFAIGGTAGLVWAIGTGRGEGEGPGLLFKSER